MSENATQLVNGRYRVVSQLGAGSYGVVYKAEDTILQKTVALKMLNLKGLDPKVLVRFQNEAKATAKFEHSSIVKVFDFNSDEKGDYYLVLDFVEGKSLRSLIDENGAMSFAECYPLFVQILDGLAHAHKKGVVHRDLNPNNILVDLSNSDFPLAKIVDFGLAWLEDTEQHLTSEGVAIGTPDYMSPEQCRGQEPDARSDIYSFGCLMFATLCGRPPYIADTAVDTIMSHINDDVPLLSEVEPDNEWTPGLEEIVEKATARNPADRFQSAQELVDQLRHIANLAEEQKHTLNTSGSQVAAPQKSLRKPLILSMLTVFILIGSCILIASNGGFAIFESQSQSSDSEVSPVSATAEYEKKLASPIGAKQPFLMNEAKWTVAHCENDEELSILLNPQTSIEYLMIQKKANITGSGFKYLASLPLKRLEFRDGSLTDSGLQALPSSLKSLESIVIAGNRRISGTTIGALSRFPLLVDLDLSESSITDETLPQLAKLTALKYLNLANCTDLDGKTLSELDRLPLEDLNISGSGIDLKNVQLARFSKLQKLSASNLEVTEENVKAILRCPHLSTLELDHSEITDQSVRLIADKIQLGLGIKNCPNLTDKSLQYLESSDVFELNFSENKLSDAGIQSLIKMKKLGILRVQACGITEKRARQLLQQTKIEKIIVSKKEIPQKVAFQLNSSFSGDRIVLR